MQEKAGRIPLDSSGLWTCDLRHMSSEHDPHRNSAAHLHPCSSGPSSRPFIPGGLASAPLHSASSARLGFVAWSGFLRWVRTSVSRDPLPWFVSCPLLFAMALRAYGDYLYQAGGSLQTFRYAVVAAQRLTWGMRGQLGPACEMVSRWERLQPVEHRTPVPKLVKALVALAWCFGMR